MRLIAALFFGAVAFSHIAPFPFFLEAFRPARSLWRVPPQPGVPPTIYLTFDDGPSLQWTPPLLDALRDTGAVATFFLIDAHITPDTAPIVRRMAEAGHAIGLHSATRKLMVASPEDVAAMLEAAARRIREVAGREPCRLSPARGLAQRDDVRRVAARGVQACGVELGDVGLALVAAAAGRIAWPGGWQRRHPPETSS